MEGKYGWAPEGKARLVVGHESLGRVIDPGPRSSLKKGDLVVGIVRRPDPIPCSNCAVGEWDMCRNGQYTERGIKEIDGFMSERWRIEPEYAMKVDSSLGLMGKAARSRGSRPRPSRIGIEAGACSCPRGHLPHRQRSGHRVRAGRHRRMHRCRSGYPRCYQGHWRAGCRVPYGCRNWRLRSGTRRS